MDGWVDGWVDGWMDGWVDGWKGGWMDAWMGRWMHGWADGCMEGLDGHATCIDMPTCPVPDADAPPRHPDASGVQEPLARQAPPAYGQLSYMRNLLGWLRLGWLKIA